MYTYIHIPFCKTKCSYCDFFSIVPSETSKWRATSNLYDSPLPIIPDEYITALLEEAKHSVAEYDIKSWKSLYVGGGTPSLLSQEQVRMLFNGLTAICPVEKNAEVTFEVNPYEIASDEGTLYLKLLTDCGVNRISCGIQSLSDSALTCVNRRATKDECIGALESLLKWKTTNNMHIHSDSQRHFQFSIDLIAGLPTLSMADFKQGLHTVLSYNPDHISLYSLMIEDGTPLANDIDRGVIKADENTIDAQWLEGFSILKNKNYFQYEVSNFANSASSEGEHNKAYWKMENYIGLGSGSCGTIDNIRSTGTKSVKDYCLFWNEFTSNKTDLIPQTIRTIEHLTNDDRIIEFLLMGFRTLQGVNAVEFYNRFKVKLEDKIGSVFTKWVKNGLATKNADYYALNEKGLLYLNSFLSEII